MKNFIIRPYYGHDCDSENGFNNGHYLDEIAITAENEGEAIGKAMDLVKAEFLNDPTKWSNDSHFGDDHLYCEFDHFWLDFEDNVVAEDTENAECFYLYKYIAFTDIKEEGEND